MKQPGKECHTRLHISTEGLGFLIVIMFTRTQHEGEKLLLCSACYKKKKRRVPVLQNLILKSSPVIIQRKEP